MDKYGTGRPRCKVQLYSRLVLLLYIPRYIHDTVVQPSSSTVPYESVLYGLSSGAEYSAPPGLKRKKGRRVRDETDARHLVL